MTAYILIVIFHVNSGSVPTMQEFNSKQSCENAITVIKAVDIKEPELIVCVEK